MSEVTRAAVIHYEVEGAEALMKLYPDIMAMSLELINKYLATTPSDWKTSYGQPTKKLCVGSGVLRKGDSFGNSNWSNSDKVSLAAPCAGNFEKRLYIHENCNLDVQVFSRTAVLLNLILVWYLDIMELLYMKDR